jgi:hypothetical protein
MRADVAFEEGDFRTYFANRGRSAAHLAESGRLHRISGNIC